MHGPAARQPHRFDSVVMDCLPPRGRPPPPSITDTDLITCK